MRASSINFKSWVSLSWPFSCFTSVSKWLTFSRSRSESSLSVDSERGLTSLVARPKLSPARGIESLGRERELCLELG